MPEPCSTLEGGKLCENGGTITGLMVNGGNC